MPKAAAPHNFSRWIRQLRSSARARVSLLGGLTAAFVVLLALELVEPSGFEAPTLRATIETGMTLFAFAAAWLTRAQFHHTRRQRDLLLLAAVLTLGLVHLCAYAAPAALDLPSRAYITALGLWGNLFAAMLFAAAATVSGDKLVLDGRHARDVVAGLSLSALLASALCALLLRSGLLAGHSSRHGIDAALARPLALALMLGTAGLFAYVAATLARHDRAAANSGGSLLAGAAMVLAAARTSQLTGSAASHTITPADGLQLLGFGLILAAAVRRELHARAVGARAAALAERQRVARDLHDGLAQDLAFIAAHGERIAADIGAEHPVVIAARRALAISRSAIAELSDPAGATAHEALEAIAAELRDRFGISIAVNVELSEELAPDVQEHVSRIAREAIANAARHGGAKHVVVSLDDVEGAVTLRVQDDGSGIQCARDGSAPEGFGLRSMRERASALGGQVTVGQVHERGTLLEVVLP